jgi:hypothetical protein
MRVAVDNARRHVLAGRVDDADTGRGREIFADPRDLAVLDKDVRRLERALGRRHNSPVLDQNVTLRLSEDKRGRDRQHRDHQ